MSNLYHYKRSPTRRTRIRYRIAVILHAKDLSWREIGTRIGMVSTSVKTMVRRCSQFEREHGPIREGYELTRGSS